MELATLFDQKPVGVLDTLYYCICFPNNYKTKRKPLSTSLGDVAKELHALIISERPKCLCLCFQTEAGVDKHKWYENTSKEDLCSR